MYRVRVSPVPGEFADRSVTVRKVRMLFLVCHKTSSPFHFGHKNNSQQERVFRLRWLPEDDTIFLRLILHLRMWSTVETCRYCKIAKNGVSSSVPVLVAPGRFFYLLQIYCFCSKFFSQHSLIGCQCHWFGCVINVIGNYRLNSCTRLYVCITHFIHFRIFRILWCHCNI